jgi:hypothetical protein
MSSAERLWSRACCTPMPNLTYRIHERDRHPNALANKLIAQYVVSQVLPPPAGVKEAPSAPFRDLDADSAGGA